MGVPMVSYDAAKLLKSLLETARLDIGLDSAGCIRTWNPGAERILTLSLLPLLRGSRCIAEFERDLIRERTSAGREAAKQRQGLARDRHVTVFPDFEQFCIAGFPASTQVFA
jgi:PAS domain-containing protein